MADAFQPSAFQDNAFGISEGLHLAATEARDVAAVVAHVEATFITMAAVEAQDGAPRAAFDPGHSAAEIAFSNGNLTISNSVDDSVPVALSNISHSSGKFYFEMWQESEAFNDEMAFGIAPANVDLNDWLGKKLNTVGIFDTGSVFNSFELLGPAEVWDGPPYAVGERVGIAVDLDAGKVWFRNAAGWVGDPVAGTDNSGHFAPGQPYFAAGSLWMIGDVISANFGGGAFAYAAPAGFAAWGAGRSTHSFNPNDKDAAVVLSDRNRSAIVAATDINRLVRSVTCHSSGRHYFEAQVNSQGDTYSAGIGFATKDVPTRGVGAGGWIGGTYHSLGLYVPTVRGISWGSYQHSSDDSSYIEFQSVLAAPGERLGIAVDFDTGQIWFRNADGWEGDPVAGTGSVISVIPHTALFVASSLLNANDSVAVRLAAAEFAYPAPAGFAAWEEGIIDAFTANVAVLGQTNAITLDPVHKSAQLTLSNNNLTVTAGSGITGWAIARSLQSFSTGKRYFEGISDTVGAWTGTVGLVASDHYFDGWYMGQPGTLQWSLGYYPSGHVYAANTGAVDSVRPYTDEWVGLAVDFDAGKVWVRNRDGWFGDPVAGTGGIDIYYYTSNRAFYAAVGPSQVGAKATTNLGATPFAYPVPAGFTPWATSTATGFNQVDKHPNLTLSNNNRTVSDSLDSYWLSARHEISYDRGKFYFEGRPDFFGAGVTSSVVIGLADAYTQLDSFIGVNNNPWSLGYFSHGDVYHNSSIVTTRGAFAVGEWAAIAVDFDAGKIWVRNASGWVGDPVAGTSPVFTFTPNMRLYAACSEIYNGTKATFNFGATPFAYAPPAGYRGWTGAAVEAQDSVVITTAVISHQLALASTEAKDVAAFATTIITTGPGDVILAVSEAPDTAAFNATFYDVIELFINVFPGVPDTMTAHVASGDGSILDAFEGQDVAAILAVNVGAEAVLAATETPDASVIVLDLERRGVLAATEAQDFFGWGPDAFQRNAFQLYSFGGINIQVYDSITLAATEGFVDHASFVIVIENELVLEVADARDVAIITAGLDDTFTMAATETPDRSRIFGLMGDGFALNTTEERDVASIDLRSILDMRLFVLGTGDTAAMSLQTGTGMVLGAQDVQDVVAIELNRMNGLTLAATERPDVASILMIDTDDEVVCVRPENRVLYVRYENRVSRVPSDGRHIDILRERRRSDTYNRRRAC